MSGEEKFKRSEIGHDANDLHKNGGLSSLEGHTEREDLENAIEALSDSEETENLQDIVKDIKEDKAEEAKEAEPEKKIDIETEAKIEEALMDEESAKPEPKDGWKVKKENLRYMTVEEIVDPKAKKGGLGWKIAAFLFLALAILGCGASAYILFNNGKTEFLGRVITSTSKEKKARSGIVNPETGEIEEINAGSGRYIFLDGYDLVLKVPDTLSNISYRYDRFNVSQDKNSTFTGNYSTLAFTATTKKEGAQALPSFIWQDTDDFEPLVYVTIAICPTTEVIGPSLIMKTDDNHCIYVETAQAGLGTADDYEWETETVAEIQKWLNNKDSYIKTK